MTINFKFESDKRIPPVRSSIWEAIVPPLLDYLSSSRSIDEIIEWSSIRGCSHSMANNMLAWLSFTGKARYDDFSCRWMWGSSPLADEVTRSTGMAAILFG